MAKPYRLGLDIGTNSIGWCLYELDKGDEIVRLMRMGVRIFSDGRDPKTRTSLAVERRLKRQQRRQRERTVQRRHGFLNELIRANLLPEEEQARKALVNLDPYELRSRALDQAIPIPQLARALYHLARKRGFKSSRKDLGGGKDAKESGKIAEGTAQLKAKIETEGCRTVGEWLWRRHQQRIPVLARPSNQGAYEFYPDRGLVLDEFDAIWAKQREFHGAVLSQDTYRRLRYFIAHQRPLKAVPAGACVLEPTEKRARRGHPLFSMFRILSDLANLRIELPNGDAIPLNARERDACLKEILAEGKLTWARLRKILNIEKKKDDPEPFNLARNKQKELVGDKVSLGLSAPSCFGDRWASMSISQQADVIDCLALSHDLDNLRERLLEKGVQVSPEQLTSISAVTVPDGFADLSLKALEKLVPIMASQVMTYDRAVLAAGYRSHSDFLPAEDHLQPRLPYYGEVLRGYVQPMPLTKVREERESGRLPNPTVHVGLNQLRKLVNAVIDRYGRPRQIIIEMTREFGMSGQRRGELISEQRKNEAANEARRAELRRLGVTVNRENLLRLRLWEELPVMNRVCVYSGRAIGSETLFTAEIEIDHILPFSRSLDDGIGNLVLGYRAANRVKGNRDPHAAFGHNPPGYSWEDILARVASFAEGSTAWRNKAKRFLPDALAKFEQERGFLDRHLTDTAYLSRLAKQYLSHVCFKDRVWVATGRLTAMLRGKWDLSDALGGHGKNRNDHRHHAIDAAVVGACDRRIIQQLSHAAEAFELGRSHRFFEQLGQPFEGFTGAVREAVQKIIVSHKPDRDPGGSLHNDTYYGVLEPAVGKTPPLVVHRVPLITLTDAVSASGIVDPALRHRVLAVIEGCDKKQAALAVQRFAEASGIRTVRVQERLSVAEIPNPKRSFGRAVKTDGNAYVDIIRTQKGWTDRVVSRFAHARGAGLDDGVIMRLYDGDVLAIDTETGQRRIMRVVAKTDGFITLAEHFEAGSLRDRHRDGEDSFRYLFPSANALRKLRARRAAVDLLGFVHDPGFVE